MNSVRFEILNPQYHNRNGFDCGEQSLNIFLRLYASQQQKQGFGITYAAIAPSVPETILGYYTISASSLEATNLDYFSKRKIPYKKIPTIKIGRLARDLHNSQSGFGTVILQNALCQCLNLSKSQIGVCAIEVDLINEKVKRFYEAFGFLQIPGSPLTLCLPIATIRESVSQNRMTEA